MAFGWQIGVALSICSTCLSALGQTLQRLSVLRARSDTQSVFPWQRPLWVNGLSLYVLAALFDVASYLHAPMAIIIIVYALRLPVVAVLASAILGVHIPQACAIGIALCASGASLSLLFAPAASTLVLHCPADFFTKPVVCYIVASGAGNAALGVYSVAGSMTALGGKSTPCRELALPLLVAWVRNIEKLFNSGMGRLAPGESFLHLRWAWMPLSVALLTAMGGLLNLYSVEHQSTHTFVPAVFGFEATIVGLQSVLLGEFREMPAWHTVCWSAGICVAILGTVLVGLSGSKEGDSAEEPLSKVVLEESTDSSSES
mmetsp:Transcript_40088/g.80976  ORF Transcript_40088/g.80976 Transcript_40088/m.80976 type:complete len:316 (+) Transcript_40088:103-1050(+)